MKSSALSAVHGIQFVDVHTRSFGSGLVSQDNINMCNLLISRLSLNLLVNHFFFCESRILLHIVFGNICDFFMTS
jgi:hypothetical protein